MREPYIPLFTSVVRSSLWSETGDCIKVFLTLCSEADPEGFVSASVDGIRRLADLTLEDTLRHIATLEAPDPNSKDTTRDPSRDGRRIEKVPNGWRVINLPWHREQARKQAELFRKRRWWNESGSDARRAARRTETETETETETTLPQKEEIPPVGSPRKRRILWHFAPDDWKPKQRHIERCCHWPSGAFMREVQAFKSHEYKDGKSDADRAFDKWLIKAEKDMRLPPPQPRPKKVDW